MKPANPKRPTTDPTPPPRFVRARRLQDSQRAVITEPPMHASESAAVASPRATSLATLLTGHVLRDGEIVLLVLKPSLWFIVFQSILFAAAVLLLLLVARVFGDRLSFVHRVAYIEAAVFLIAGRMMWAVLQWIGRLYVLTDQRIIRLAGVFTVDIYDCPLRKVARTQITSSVKEKLCRVGSIEIHPKEEFCPVGLWQTVPHPLEVNEQINAAIHKAQSGGTS
jgi:hypothetical protein